MVRQPSEQWVVFEDCPGEKYGATVGAAGMRSTSDWPVAFSCSWNHKRAKWELGVRQARQQGDHVIGVAVRVRPAPAHQTKLSPTRLPPATIAGRIKEHACAAKTA